MRILLVEDDDMLGDAVREALRQESYVVDWVRAAGAALAALSTSNFSALVLDLRQRTVTCQGAPAPLTAREYAVVELLMRKAGCLVTRAEIEEELYGFDDHIASNAIEVHIHNLRRKLGPRFITNLKGRGYRVESSR